MVCLSVAAVLCPSDGGTHPSFSVALLSAGSLCAFLVDVDFGSGLSVGRFVLMLHACSTLAATDLIVFPHLSFTLWHVTEVVANEQVWQAAALSILSI